MFRKDIEKAYTDKVSEYIANGWMFHITTMAGHQGEICKSDLYKGDDVIRIMLEEKASYIDDCGNYIELIVGRNTDKIMGDRWRDTIWNNHLEVIESQKFYIIGRGEKFFGTKEEYEAAVKKHYDRMYARHRSNHRIEFPEAAKRIVWSFMKRQYDCKTIRLSQIESVYKELDRNGKARYIVRAKGKHFEINKK